MFSGEASTRPCPIDVAARSAWSDGVGTDPAYAASPICGALPSPNSAAVDGKSGGARCAVASPMKAVLHDSANSVQQVADLPFALGIVEHLTVDWRILRLPCPAWMSSASMRMPRTRFSPLAASVSRNSSGLVSTKFDGAIALAICLT